ncbi:hypothetical protein BDN72DRAFT_179728 [Pluteus cervinus]|uniref:Uncharacterized protein n=1 Tax=Pluteus cervinus TaxID=181527 RepID=A0ACD3ALI3_9AGAR|nr:hypothetical protein BDN72DRAFT_179728 [Pluteus cervinus]
MGTSNRAGYNQADIPSISSSPFSYRTHHRHGPILRGLEIRGQFNRSRLIPSREADHVVTALILVSIVAPRLNEKETIGRLNRVSARREGFTGKCMHTRLSRTTFEIQPRNEYDTARAGSTHLYVFCPDFDNWAAFALRGDYRSFDASARLEGFTHKCTC